MKALARFGKAFGGYKMIDVPEPVCGPDDVVIEIKAAAICGADMKHYNVDSGSEQFNSIRGHEFVGQIVQVGDKVKDWKVGQRVVSDNSGHVCGVCPAGEQGDFLCCTEKVNLGLDVIRRRGDGYHEVRMIMQTIQLYDKITIDKARQEGIMLETNLAFLPVNENNIAYKAARMLMEEFHIPGGLSIKIEKHIPVAAGMAGGSTDGAAVLYGINRMYRLGLTKTKLMERGVRLGADVPYCIMRGTVLSEGIGEVLTPVSPLPDCYILVAKPPISVSTKYVYEHLKLDSVEYHPDIDGMVEALEAGNLKEIADRMENVLETVTIPEHPEIGQIKEVMRGEGALNAMMSGSGPTVFGIFEDKKQGLKARDILRKGTLAKQVYLVKPFNIRNNR